MHGWWDRLGPVPWGFVGAGIGVGLVAVVLARLPLLRRRAGIGLLVTAGVVAVAVASGQVAGPAAVLAGVAPVVAAVADRHGRLAGPGWWATATVLAGAWFLTVPDTEVVATVGGAVVVAGAASVARPGPSAPTAAPLLALAATAAAEGTAGRTMAVWGVLAATGALGVLVVRRPRSPGPEVLAVQVVAGLLGARVVGRIEVLPARGVWAVVVVVASSILVARILDRRPEPGDGRGDGRDDGADDPRR